MNSVSTKYCTNCHAEVDTDVTECLNCGSKSFSAPVVKAVPSGSASTLNHATSSFGGKLYKILAWITWIVGFIWAIILTRGYGATGFFTAAMFFAICGGILYAQSELFNCIQGIYALLKESKQK